MNQEEVCSSGETVGLRKRKIHDAAKYLKKTRKKITLSLNLTCAFKKTLLVGRGERGGVSSPGWPAW